MRYQHLKLEQNQDIDKLGSHHLDTFKQMDEKIRKNHKKSPEKKISKDHKRPSMIFSTKFKKNEEEDSFDFDQLDLIE